MIRVLVIEESKRQITITIRITNYDREHDRKHEQESDNLLKAVIQRVKSAEVAVDGAVVSRIGQGLLVLLGVTGSDTVEHARYLAQKTVALRIFEDDQGKMNLSVEDIGGQVLVVSQFTLYGDCSRGRRPDFTSAAAAQVAEPLYERFCEEIEATGIHVARGVFGARMEVKLTNDGPVTIIAEKV